MDFKQLREKIEELNFQILDLLNQRAALAIAIGEKKQEQGLNFYDPARESMMLKHLLEKNSGPFPDEVVKVLFKEIFKASMELMQEKKNQNLLVSRQHKPQDTKIRFGDLEIGGPEPVIIAGPCSVESLEQMEAIATFLKDRGIRCLRGGAYKPRTSPYAFQGLKEEGLKILSEISRRFGLLIVTEVLDPRELEKVSEVSDILQIGARNMYNYELLKEVGRLSKPVLLKRGFMATIEEFLLSAEYIIGQGNQEIILCERGIRTFENWTRNTLDISAVPILKQESHLPVIVDISHSSGRKDIADWIARAAIAAGADGLMVEVHNQPQVALSDGGQQLDFTEFEKLLKAIKS